MLAPSAREAVRPEPCSASTSSSTSPSWWCWRCSSARRRCCGGWPTTTPARRSISTSPPSSPAPCCPMPTRRCAEQQKADRGAAPQAALRLALYRPNGAMIAMAGKPPPRFDAGARAHRLAARSGRAQLHPAAARRPLAGRAPGARAAQPDLLDHGVPGAGGARRRGRRLPRGARARPAAGAAEGRRRAASAAISARGSRSRAATRWRRWPQASTAPPSASRSWSPPIACCSPIAATSCARRSPASPSPPRCWATTADAKTRESLKQDIAELDQLIEEILLASRLEALPMLERHEPVDLLALAAEEAAHYDLEATGTPVTVSGDRLLLRRLIRNLLENARRYAGDGPISISVTAEGRPRRAGSRRPRARRARGRTRSASSSPSIAWPTARERPRQRPRPRPGARHRPTPWRRCGLPGGRRRRQPLPHRPAGCLRCR